MCKARLGRRFQVPKSVWGRSLPVLGASGGKQWRNTGKLHFVHANRLLRPESTSAWGLDRTFRLPMPPEMGCSHELPGPLAVLATGPDDLWSRACVAYILYASH